MNPLKINKQYKWLLNQTVLFHADPRPPENVTAILTALAPNEYELYRIRVSWESPEESAFEGHAEYFMVELDGRTLNATHGDRHVDFADVPLSGGKCVVSVQAFSRLGRGSLKASQVFTLQRRAAVDGRSLYSPQITALAAFMFCVAILAVGFKRVVRERRSSPATADAERATDGGSGCNDTDLLKLLREDVHHWLTPSNLNVSEVYLGRGHFGVVRKGTLKTAEDGGGGEYTVAVKSLRDRPSGRELEQFLGEILLMQKVGKHPNIVSMIGCCLDVNKRCMLIVEYCPLGDLQTFLKKVRESLQTRAWPHLFASLSHVK